MVVWRANAVCALGFTDERRMDACEAVMRGAYDRHSFLVYQVS